MLATARVKVVRGRVCDIASGVIGHDCNIIAYLVLVRPAFKRSKRIAYLNVRRERHAAIGAVGVKQLRIGVIGGVPGIIPDDVDPSVWGNGKRAEPMPLVVVDGVVVDPLWRAKA